MILVGLLFGFLSVSQIEGLGYYIEDAYFETLSDEYFDLEATHLEPVWQNATSSGISLNFTMIKQLPESVTGHFDLYLASMGDYKTHSGVTVNAPWCNMFNDPILMSSLVTALGMNVSDCPPPAGYYGLPYWAPSAVKMPDYFPGIDYKVEFALRFKKKVLVMVFVFVSLFS